MLRQIFDVHQEEILVADDHGVLLGYSLAVPSTGSPSDLAHYLALGVRAEDRGRGVGRSLAEETLSGLRSRGVRSVRLAVDAANTVAVKLYLSLGFTPAGYEPQYYGEGQPRIVLDLNLLAPRSANHRVSELARE
nr:GNAT family N-acetyltransferase [Frankia sp. EI5c]